MMDQEYPLDFFIPITNNDHLLGRLTVNKLGDSFSVEIDIIFDESKKIYQHIDILYKRESKEDAIDSGVSRLAQFLNSSNKNQ
ncbi:hypothetical protein HBN50_09740 [Halobacteriovorax sp. GB3]|uniref:hypothetical protein n=1 Tax=Halobacteriovorax sp. GB3 TaxID=2719615 RepID=UPI002362F369|nr:hypothetical protein [Halobacteriovorax sp. GB3]MDD0853380.1 hypothetical protein [Halobacteriovorax sp. GB3]